MRKKVYVAVWGNRHSDIGVLGFSTAPGAIRWASEKARESGRFNTIDENITPGMDRAGWIYYGRSDEGDQIRVVECLVDDKAPSGAADD